MANASLRPKPFDGSSTYDVNEFIEAFQRYAVFADWNDQRKARTLKTMLVDNAAKWLTRQDYKESIEYDEYSPSMPPGTMCHICVSPLHIAPHQCPSLCPPQTRYQPSRRPRRNKQQIQCFNCGNWGHYQSECQGPASSRPPHQRNDQDPTQPQ